MKHYTEGKTSAPPAARFSNIFVFNAYIIYVFIRTLHVFFWVKMS